MLRGLVIATLLAACAGGSRGPAWPKPSVKTADGGESLAPRRISPLAVVDVPSDEIVAIDPVTEKPIVRTTVEPTVETPIRPTPTPTVTSPDVIIHVDDIVIDIDD